MSRCLRRSPRGEATPSLPLAQPSITWPAHAQVLSEQPEIAEFLKLVSGTGREPLTPEKLLKEMDTDGDGIISLTEFAVFCEKGDEVFAIEPRGLLSPRLLLLAAAVAGGALLLARRRAA